MKLILFLIPFTLIVFIFLGCESNPPASEAKKSQFTIYSSLDNDPDIYPDNDKLETYNGYAIDNKYITEWTTWRAQKPDDWLMVDMGKKYVISEIVLNDYATKTDFPHGFVVEVTDQPPEKSLNDSKAWRVVAEGGPEATSKIGITTITLPELVTTRYVRVRLTAGDWHWWSVYEIDFK